MLGIWPWLKNKSCYPSQVVQLLFWSQPCKQSKLLFNFGQTSIMKMAFQGNPTLEAKLVHVMNTKVVPFTILDVSKVLLWPYNHFIHWSYMIASIGIYIKSTFHVIRYKNEMKFHMLMFMNAWMMLVLMKCKWQMQCLTLGCYTRGRPMHGKLIGPFCPW